MTGLPHHRVQKHLLRRIPSLHHEHGSYRWWVLANVMIGTFIAVLDATIVNVGLPKIMASFGVTVDSIEWIITAYMLVMGVMLPTSGWVADHFGYKRTYFGALFLFTLGSFLCGLSWNEDVLIISRVVQGIGAGFLMPTGMAIVMREFSHKERGMALGFWAIAAAASVSFGPLIGGYLIDNFSWQSIFDVNVPIGILGMAATLLIQREHTTENARSFDVAGFISMSIFLTFLLLALAEGNATWNIGGWTSPFIIGCFALALFGFVIFLVAELSVKHPFIELRLLKDLNFGISNAVLFVFGLGMFGSTFLLPLYLQNSLGYTAIQAGTVFLPVGILQAIMSPVAGVISDKVNAKVPIIAGIILLAVSMYMNSFLSLFSEHMQIMLPLYVRGLSMGLMFTPLSTVALSNIPGPKIAQASGMFNVIRQIGGSFGVAIFGVMLTRRTLYHTAVFGQAVAQNSPQFQSVAYGLTHFIQQTTGSMYSIAATQARVLLGSHLAQQAFVQAVADNFFIAAAISLVAVVPVFFLKETHKKEGSAPAQLGE